MKQCRRLLLLGAIAALLVLFFTTGLHEYLSLAWIKVRPIPLLRRSPLREDRRFAFILLARGA